MLMLQDSTTMYLACDVLQASADKKVDWHRHYTEMMSHLQPYLSSEVLDVHAG